MSAEEIITDQAARQADISGCQITAAVRCCILFPQAGIQTKNSVFRQIFRQCRVECVQTLDNYHAAAAVDGLHPVCLLNFEIKYRCLADAVPVQFLQATMQHRKVQRLKTFVIVGTVRIFWITPRSA